MTIRQETIIGVTVITLAVLLTCMIPGCIESERRRDETSRVVNRTCVELASNIDAEGDFIQSQPDAVDSYGHKIKAVYTKDEVFRTISVVSAGPDGKFDTSDDISFSHSIGLKHAARSVAKYLGEVTKEKVKGAVKGLKEGLKE
jgi:hypothetical protein